MTDSLISVVIPTYNRAAYLGEAITSVRNQDYSAVELIVVDDGSTDETPRLLQGLPGEVRRLCQENRGVGAARNAGIRLATGSFLAFLDSDDLWLPDKLSQQMAVFEQSPATDVVYGQAEQFISPELDADRAARLRPMAGRVGAAPLSGSILIKRTAFERIGPFDESLRIGIEMDWYARLCEQQLVVVMADRIVLRRRLHRSNLNLTHAHEHRERLLVLKRNLDRRRAQAQSQDS